MVTRLRQVGASRVGRVGRADTEHQEALRTAVVDRYRALDAIRRHSLRRTSFCRRKRIAATVQLQLGSDGRPHFSGLETCGSVWACPVCAAIIMAERAREVTTFAERWREEGGHTYMLTCTISHGLGHDLEAMRKGLAEAWRRFWQGRAAQERRRAWDIAHTVRSVEVTHGPHGWHPHTHTLLGTRRKLTESDRYEMAMAWKAAVRAVLGSDHEPNVQNGVQLTESRQAEYLVKLGLETAQILTKGAHAGHRTSWQIMHDAAAGDARSVSLWRQYTQAMLGARQLTWSRGTKRHFHLRNKTDKQIVDDDNPHSPVTHVMAEFQGKTWDAYSRRIRFWTSSVVAAAYSETPYSALRRLPGVKERSPPGIVRPQCPTVEATTSHP